MALLPRMTLLHHTAAIYILPSQANEQYSVREIAHTSDNIYPTKFTPLEQKQILYLEST